MDIALRHKFTQHRDLKALLLGTGGADLVEVRGVLPFRSTFGFNGFRIPRVIISGESGLIALAAMNLEKPS